MKLAVRASKVDAVKLQLQSSLELQEVNIIVAPTNYAGITLLDLDESAVSTLSSIRNIEALLLDEEVAAKLKQSSTADETLSVKSLDVVDEREQYEYLSQLLHIQKAKSDKISNSPKLNFPPIESLDFSSRSSLRQQQHIFITQPI